MCGPETGRMVMVVFTSARMPSLLWSIMVHYGLRRLILVEVFNPPSEPMLSSDWSLSGVESGRKMRKRSSVCLAVSALTVL